MSPQILVVWWSLAALPAPAASLGQAAQSKAAPAKPAAKVPSFSNAAPAAKASPVAQPVVVAQNTAASAPAAQVAQPPQGTSAAPEASAAAPAPQPQVAAPSPAAAPDWLSQDQTQAQASEPLQRWPLVLAMLLLLAAGGAYMALRVRQGQSFWPGGVSGHAIEILAVKALGHKHRLVLIETSGERLLLSATERELRLLSHVASQEQLAIDAVSDAAQVAQLAAGMGPQARQAPMGFSNVGAAYQAPSSSRLQRAEPAPQSSAAAATVSVASAAGQAQYGPMAPSSPMLAAPQAPAAQESLSAEALYEGAARSMDLDEQDDDLDDPQQTAAQDNPGALASDVAGLARWRQAAAQGAETWGKQV